MFLVSLMTALLVTACGVHIDKNRFVRNEAALRIFEARSKTIPGDDRDNLSDDELKHAENCKEYNSHALDEVRNLLEKRREQVIEPTQNRQQEIIDHWHNFARSSKSLEGTDCANWTWKNLGKRTFELEKARQALHVELNRYQRVFVCKRFVNEKKWEVDCVFEL